MGLIRAHFHDRPYDGAVDAWAWWVIAFAAFCVVEVVTLDLVFIMIAGGALAGAAVAGLDEVTTLPLGLPVQIAVATIVAVALLGAVRPVALRHLRQPAELRTGARALEGAKAVVLERVDGNGGLVKLAGEVWTARSYDGLAAFEPGQSVDVIKIEGATALVL
jgi:membrane protein implicated in regulation of membrane protease activity